jgi:hypothetical protein
MVAAYLIQRNSITRDKLRSAIRTACERRNRQSGGLESRQALRANRSVPGTSKIY